MNKFSVGEDVYIVDPNNGSIMTDACVEKPKDSHGFYYLSVDGHKSKDRPDGTWAIAENYLRKKKPPEELSRWSQVEADTGWNPTKEVVYE